MRITRAAALSSALVLTAGLSACGGGGGTESASGGTSSATSPTASANPNANSPGAGGALSPGTGSDAYKATDPYVNAQKTSAPAKTIVMSGFAFIPTEVTVKPGEVWTEENDDPATHNITTEKLAAKKGTGGDIAPDVGANQKKTFKMPTKPGTYKTVCYYHQNMVLTIVVKK